MCIATRPSAAAASRSATRQCKARWRCTTRTPALSDHRSLLVILLADQTGPMNGKGDSEVALHKPNPPHCSDHRSLLVTCALTTRVRGFGGGEQGVVAVDTLGRVQRYHTLFKRCRWCVGRLEG